MKTAAWRPEGLDEFFAWALDCIGIQAGAKGPDPDGMHACIPGTVGRSGCTPAEPYPPSRAATLTPGSLPGKGPV